MSAPSREPGVVLSELHTDETYGIKIGVTKQVRNTIIDKTALGNPQFDLPTLPSGSYVEVQALNKLRSITICSKLAMDQTDLDALAVTIPGTIDFPWPGTLQSVTVYKDQGTHTSIPTGTFTSVTIGGEFSFSGGVSIDIKDGPRSKSVASLARTFHATVPTISETITKIQTSTGSVVIQGGREGDWTTYSVGSGTSGTVEDITHSNDFQTVGVPSCLTNGVTLGTFGFGQASAYMDLSPSTPVTFNIGDVIVANIEVVQWRFGVFVKEVTRVTRP